MTIKQLKQILDAIPKSQQDNAVYVFDRQTGVTKPIDKVKPYTKHDPISRINPLTLIINHETR